MTAFSLRTLVRSLGPVSHLAIRGVWALAACGPTTMMQPGSDGASMVPDDATLDGPVARDEGPTRDAGATDDARDAGAAPDAGDAGDAGATEDAGVEAGTLGTLEFRAETRSTGASGVIDVTVHVEEHRSFMVVANAESEGRLAVLSVRDPRGTTVLRWEDWFNGTRNLTNAFSASRTGTTLNWPVRADDGPLVRGDYVVSLASYRNDETTVRPNVSTRITTLTRRDTDPSHGRVRVVIVWCAGIGTNRTVVTATESAVAHWRAVWASAGMDFDVRYVESTLPPALPYPSASSAELFLQASSYARDGEIPVVIGETVDDNPTQYGAAGHLPGPVVRSPLRAIVVGWLANAGGDGAFSDNDVDVYGEVLAHEVGHYLGLFHPVERDYTEWDALSDTPECRNERNCESMLGTNLMFPYSICDTMSCVSATVLTAQQHAVMQRYTGSE